MKRRSLFWGSFFILSAALIVLNQMDYLLGVNLVSLIITLILIPFIFKSIQYRSFSGVMFPLAVIAILFDKQLGIESLTPWPILGVALFLSIGLNFIFPKDKKWFKEVISKNDNTFSSSETGVSDDEEVYVSAKFGESIKYINSKSLKKVNVYCQFSGVKVYFDDAEIDGNEAIINVSSSFSGIELYIPRKWHVKSQVSCFLGGVEEKGVREYEVQEKVVYLKGNISFSGITIRYV